MGTGFSPSRSSLRRAKGGRERSSADPNSVWRCRVSGLMAVSRRRRRRRQVPARLAPIGIGALVLTLLPSTIAFQGLGAMLARQPAVPSRARAHLIPSSFGTIHAAMFSLPRPLGTAIPAPPPYALANFDPTDITGSTGAQPLGDASAPLPFPQGNTKNTRGTRL